MRIVWKWNARSFDSSFDRLLGCSVARLLGCSFARPVGFVDILSVRLVVGLIDRRSIGRLVRRSLVWSVGRLCVTYAFIVNPKVPLSKWSSNSRERLNSRHNVYFVVFCSRTSLEDIEDEDEIEEYESEDETDKGKQVRTTIMLQRQILISRERETLRWLFRRLCAVKVTTGNDNGLLSSKEVAMATKPVPFTKHLWTQSGVWRWEGTRGEGGFWQVKSLHWLNFNLA